MYAGSKDIKINTSHGKSCPSPLSLTASPTTYVLKRITDIPAKLDASLIGCQELKPLSCTMENSFPRNLTNMSLPLLLLHAYVNTLSIAPNDVILLSLETGPTTPSMTSTGKVFDHPSSLSPMDNASSSLSLSTTGLLQTTTLRILTTALIDDVLLAPAERGKRISIMSSVARVNGVPLHGTKPYKHSAPTFPSITLQHLWPR